MKASKVKKAPYNPRRMSDKARKALQTSMEEFNDISGIVWNSRTGNLVSGNHRWENLVEKYGQSNIDLRKIKDLEGYFAIFSGEKNTGFILREVDWDEDTEKAANITANNEKLQGEFTDSISDILKDLSSSGSRVSKSIFSGLRLDELKLDFGIDDIKFDSTPDFDLEGDIEDLDFDIPDSVTNYSNEEEEDTEETFIKVKCLLSQKSRIVELIKNALINENDIEIR